MIKELKSIWRMRDLIFLWARYNIQGRYIEVKLGLLWIVFRPLGVTVIYSVVFSELLNRPPTGGVPYFMLFLSGLTVWELISNSFMQSTTSIVSKLSLMSQINFPRESIILVNMIERLVDFMVNSLILIVFAASFGFFPSTAYLYIPIVLISIIAFSLSGAFIIAPISVFVRDIQEIISLVLRFLFFFSGVIFSLDMLSEDLQKYIVFNPFMLLIESYRGIILYNKAPPLEMLMILLVVSLIFLVFGYKFFKSKEGTFVDYL